MANYLLPLDFQETQLCDGENWWSRHAQTDACTRSNICVCSERHAGAVNITLWPHQHVETPMRGSLSMNWSNPVLRWGHASQPITTGLDIRHPALSQSTCLCVFFSPSSRSLPLFSCWVSFFLKYYFMSNVPPPPGGGSGNHLLVCARHFFVSPKALVRVSLQLVCCGIVCASFIHKVHNDVGEIPQTSEAVSTPDYRCLHWPGVSQLYGHLYNPHPLQRGCSPACSPAYKACRSVCAVQRCNLRQERSQMSLGRAHSMSYLRDLHWIPFNQHLSPSCASKKVGDANKKKKLLIYLE